MGEKQVFENKPIGNGANVLDPSLYRCQVAINKTTSNALEAVPPGGVAALYVQHVVDASIAPVANVNCGARIQIQSAQRAVTGVVNDLVGTYVGVYSSGENVGGFGYHVDAYHVAKGASVMYGMSAEMSRLSPEGLTIGSHVRSISGVGMFDNDFGFLASNGGGAAGFKRAYAAGSPATGGKLTCDIGLDLTHATCDKATVAYPASALHRTAGTLLGYVDVMVGGKVAVTPVYEKA